MGELDHEGKKLDQLGQAWYSSVCLGSAPVPGPLAHSAGAASNQLTSVWWSVRVLATGLGSWAVMGLASLAKGGPTSLGSWLVWSEDRLRMGTRGKDKDLEKGLSTPERMPKDQTRTVARPRNHEDLSRGWICGLWDIVSRVVSRIVFGLWEITTHPAGSHGKGTRKSKTSQKGKEAAGGSGQVEADGTNPTVLLPIQTDGANVGARLPNAQLNPTRFVWLELELSCNRSWPADGADEQQQRELEDEGGSSHAGRQDGHGEAAGNVTARLANPATEPSMKDVLEVMKAMGNQMIALTQVFTPFVNSSVGQAVPLASRRVEQVSEVVEMDPPPWAVRKMDYLKLLEHIAKMSTKHFAGSVDPLEADEWRSRLVRNFNSTRCPEDYQKDIAVHFLEGDAHYWWLALDKRTNGTMERFSDFVVEFNHKYFLAEAWDRLESKFLDLVQGRRTVREYEEDFNRLRRYVGNELEDESFQVGRFIRGHMVELRTYCSVHTFHIVSEVVERLAMLETNLAEEAKLKIRRHPAATGGNSDRKRKRDLAEEGKSSSGRSVCLKCGRQHGGECWRAMEACLQCGMMDHSARDCPRKEQGAGGDTRTCHYCGRKGHLRKDCPKLSSGPINSRGETSRPDQNRGQTLAPCVYELSKDEDKA
ncbi:hypothetical protein N665_0488s0004 [Sinapis alba]|nr:hypothetical protein N665_0488s0004 [Sinapis alba]